MQAVFSTAPGVRAAYACLNCSERKVRCDKEIPCGACSKRRIQCGYRALPSPRKRRRVIKDDTAVRSHESHDAFRRARGVAEVTPPTSTTSPPEQESISRSLLLNSQGRTKFVDNVLWTHVAEELPDHVVEGGLGESADDSDDDERIADHSAFVVTPFSNADGKLIHPNRETIAQLWEIFVSNVDPVLKIVHVPTLKPAVDEATQDLEQCARGFEALLFSIYSAAVMSLQDGECSRQLGESRSILLSRYLSATKSALARARFMSTTSLIVLQALVIYIVCLRNIHDARAMWTMTGVGLRIAEGMGLHRDGTALGLPPFETELRRRTWWLLKTHDSRAADLCGAAKFRIISTGVDLTRIPTNINDKDIYPDMQESPTDTDSGTDIMFPMIWIECSNFATQRMLQMAEEDHAFTQLDHTLSRKDSKYKDEVIKEIEALLESKYLRYCDPSVPLHMLALIAARLTINNIKFVSYHPRRWTESDQVPEEEREYVWKVCMKIVEQHNMMQTDPKLARYLWMTPYCMPWHPFIHIIDTLKRKPHKSDAEDAWRLIASVYTHNPSLISNVRKPIHAAVDNLCLKAYLARETALKAAGLPNLPIPDCIRQLRNRFASIKKSRQLRRASPATNHGRAHAEPSEIQQMPSSQTVNDLPKSQTVADSYWLNQNFDGAPPLESSALDVLDTNLFSQESSVVDVAAPNIDWSLWDAWMASDDLPATWAK